LRTQKILTRTLFIFLSLTFISCSTTKLLKENENLLVKNSVTIDKKNSITTDELNGYIQQRPNKKFLGVFRFNTWVYLKTEKGKESGFNKWINKVVGKNPVILDTNIANNSAEQIKMYLNNKGYFHSEVYKSVDIRRKKAKVIYFVNLFEPYKIKKISYQVDDRKLLHLLDEGKKKSLIEIGNIYDAYTLDDERTRITKFFKNEGYYYFTKEYITYKVDSAFKNHQLDIELDIKNVRISSGKNEGEYTEREHRRYYFDKFFIFPDYKTLRQDSLVTDTVFFRPKLNEQFLNSEPYNFIYHDKLRIKPQVITRSVFINSDSYYNLKDVDETYKGLSELRLYKFVNIQFQPREGDSLLNKKKDGILDTYIQLRRFPVQSYSIEAEGTNSAGDPGLAANFIYQNKNIFQGAEIFNLKLRGAAEMQSRFGESSETSFLFFNTFETGIEASLYIPKFLIPVKPERFSKYFQPKTNFNIGYNYQNRPDYRRHITNVSFGYDWKESETKRHIFFPAEINLVKIFPDTASDFWYNVENSKDQRLKNQYTDHLIPGLKYSFIFNNQRTTRTGHFIYFNPTFESAGNLIKLIDNIVGAPKTEDGYHTLFNIQYAQYVRLNFDFRYYRILIHDQAMVYRLYAGAGIPYGNSNVLPFEKVFYAGGANGMRGWEIRSLGPGAYKDTSSVEFEKNGDIQIEANIEYRFPLYKIFKGAIFTDVGNIWLNKKSDELPGGEFIFNKFITQMAIDAGLGLRLDFSFFIFRIDAAIKVGDPSKKDNKYWVNLGKLSLPDVLWNFGIGYPF